MRLSPVTLAIGIGVFSSAVAAAQGPAIDHSQPGCVVARQFPLLTARIDPMDRVARARVYFRATGKPQWYYVDMRRVEGMFRATLPRPRKGTPRIEYYIEALDTSAASTRTPDYSPAVVTGKMECSRVAVAAGTGTAPSAVAVGAPPGAPLVPAGFEANGIVAAVAPAAVGAAVAATAAAAGAGGGIGATAIVVGGVVVAGGAAAAALRGGGGAEDGIEPGHGPDQASQQCGTVTIVDRTSTTLTVAWSGGQPTDGTYVVDGGAVAPGTDCRVLAHDFPSVVVQGLSLVVRGLSPGTTYSVHVHPAGAPCASCTTGYDLSGPTVGAAVGTTAP
jgi:hypothetical protein